MATNYIKSSGLEVKSPIKVNAAHPVDARGLVDKIDDLYSAYTWAVGDHNDLSNCIFYIYDGMIVSTKEKDEKDRPQLYVLHNVDDLFDDYKLKDIPNDPEHWLTENNWQKIGYITDIDDSQFVFLNVKYGWTIIADDYEGPQYFEETDDYYDEVYDIDINNVEPGGEGYIPTLADPYNALKMRDDKSLSILYVDAKKFTNLNIISIQQDKDINPVADLNKNENIIFRGLGSLFVSGETFDYSSQNIHKSTIDIGLKWQPIGPKPSEIIAILDLSNSDIYSDISGKRVINNLFDYTKWEERDDKYFLTLSSLSFNHRMTYEDWDQYKTNPSAYNSVAIFDTLVDLPKVCKNISDTSWVCDVTENDTDTNRVQLSNWMDVVSFNIKCKPGSKYTILLKPV